MRRERRMSDNDNDDDEVITHSPFPQSTYDTYEWTASCGL
jgi:hypothetical protein